MKCIKKMNDFVLGILMILLSAFLVFGKITETEVKTGQGGFLVRSDVWLRMMGVFLVIVAVILIIRSFGKNIRNHAFAASGADGEEAEGFHFYLDSTVVAVIVSLIVYALALPKVGFMITTFLMCLYLVILFSVKEQSLTFRTVPKALWGKLLVKGVLSAAVMLAVFWFIFGKLLSVQFPTFSLFG